MTLFHAAALLLAAAFALVEVAMVPIPLPLPARSPDALFETWMLEPPPKNAHGAALPPKFYKSLRPPKDPRGDRLRSSARLFAGGPLKGGVETVAVTRDGRGLAMVDGRGRLWRAVRRDAGGSGQRRPPTFALSPPVPLANLTPGLTTGAGLSPDGRLAYFANAPLGLVKVELPPWEEGEGEEGGEGGAGGKAAAAPPPPRLPRITFLANRVDPDDPLAPGAELLFPDGLDVVAASAGGVPVAPLSVAAEEADANNAQNAKNKNTQDHHVVYFSSATDIPPMRLGADNSYDAMSPALLSICRGVPRGMLLAHFPGNGSTRALVGPGGATAADPTGASAPSGGLWFANGVALAHDGQSVLVADSVQAAIRRYWLAGPNAGSLDTFADALPGAPDGVARAADGRSYWVAIYAPLPPPLRWSHVRLVRAMLAWAPAFLRPKPEREGMVLRLDAQSGAVLDVYGDAGARGGVWGVTSAVEAENERGGGFGGWLLMGSLHEDGVRAVRVEERMEGQGDGGGHAAAGGGEEEEEEDGGGEWETEEGGGDDEEDEYDDAHSEL